MLHVLVGQIGQLRARLNARNILRSCFVSGETPAPIVRCDIQEGHGTERAVDKLGNVFRKARRL